MTDDLKYAVLQHAIEGARLDVERDPSPPTKESMVKNVRYYYNGYIELLNKE